MVGNTTHTAAVQYVATGFDETAQTYHPMRLMRGMTEITTEREALQWWLSNTREPEVGAGHIMTKATMAGLCYDFALLGKQMGTHTADQSLGGNSYAHKLTVASTYPNELLSFYEEESGGTTTVRHSFEKCLPYNFNFHIEKGSPLIEEVAMHCGKRTVEASTLSAAPVVHASPTTTFGDPPYYLGGASFTWDGNAINNIQSFICNAGYVNAQPYFVQKASDSQSLEGYQDVERFQASFSLAYIPDSAYEAGYLTDIFADSPTAKTAAVTFTRGDGGNNEQLAFTLGSALCLGTQKLPGGSQDGTPPIWAIGILGKTFSAYDDNEAVADAFYT